MSLPHVIPQHLMWDLIRELHSPRKSSAGISVKALLCGKPVLKCLSQWSSGAQEAKEMTGKAPRDTYCRSDEQIFQRRHWTSYGAALPQPRSFSRNSSCRNIPAPWDKENQLIHLQHWRDFKRFIMHSLLCTMWFWRLGWYIQLCNSLLLFWNKLKPLKNCLSYQHFWMDVALCSGH